MSALAGNRAAAQTDLSMLPDAADGLNSTAPVAAPPLKFTDAKGRALTLSDYVGHVLVVNLWATWCGPCVDEIPSLATLAAQIQPAGGLVLPISIDSDGAQAVSPFYTSHQITNLPILLDPDGDNLDILNTDGVPVTLIINAEGKMVGRLDGAANWNTPRIQVLLKSLLSAEPSSKHGHVTAI